MSLVHVGNVIKDALLMEMISPSSVIQAINKKEGVVVTYDDTTSTAHKGPRYIEPYCYGTTTAGNDAVWCFQYYGDTKRGVPDWKLMRLDRFQSWNPSGEHFEAEPKARGWLAAAFNPNSDKSMTNVYNVVKFDDGKEELTDLERLRMKTRKLQQQPRLNIQNFKNTQSQAQQQPKTNPNAYGPAGQQKATTNGNAKPIPEPQASKQTPDNNVLRGPVETPPATAQTQQPATTQAQQPETTPSTAAQKAARNVNMSDQEFRDMLARNLQRTDKEKARRGFSVNRNR